MILLLSALAGATHVLAPDHWVPSSVLAWRRRWRPARGVAFAAGVLTAHVVAGLGLYALLAVFFAETGARGFFPITLAFVAFLGLLRIARYSRVRGVLRSPPNSLMWSIVSVISVIGPAEALVPVLVRAREVGEGLWLPLLTFWLGTLASGLGLALVAPWIWDRPLLLPKGLAWAERRRAAIPIVMGVALAATWLLR